MDHQEKLPISQRLRNLVIGKSRDLRDPNLFHKLSLIVFFAWIGLGSDGLTSSCYGPEEAFLALKSHMFLGIFVALASALTIFVISSSYSQIVELFPTGGGGYLVASKLLSPSLGMVSGCALLVDYVLTITLSIASGADALFSFLPIDWYPYRLACAVAGVLVLIVLNLRGVKESVVPLVPIFLVFLVAHVFAILYTVVVHLADIQAVVHATVNDVQKTSAELGIAGMIVLILRSYSLGAGTYTGIEAVSNGMPILRDPKVETAKRTMRYMATSLAFMVVGLMLGYLLFKVEYQPGKTLNAVLLESLSAGWSRDIADPFVIITLMSEALLLFVAAQTGFFDAPRVLANMALDRWFPTRFAILSDRFVIQNGIVLMGAASLVLMIVSAGSVRFLVVLYSINVFITFFLSQLGMVRHWWTVKSQAPHWRKKIAINGIGLAMTVLILVSIVVIKFDEGGWITIFITGSLAVVAILTRRHYKRTFLLLDRLNSLISAADIASSEVIHHDPSKAGGVPEEDPKAKTAVILVNGYNGLGLHTLFNVLRVFGDNFKNFFFIQAGILDAGNFKGVEEIEKLKEHVRHELNRYVVFMRSQGFYAKGFSAFGTDIVDEICTVADKVVKRYPQAAFFGGQMVFARETLFTRFLHNYTTFAVQRKLYQRGIPFVIMPIRID